MDAEKAVAHRAALFIAHLFALPRISARALKPHSLELRLRRCRRRMNPHAKIFARHYASRHLIRRSAAKRPTTSGARLLRRERNQVQPQQRPERRLKILDLSLELEP